MNLKQLKSLIAQGESETLEFKTSTAQLKPACETLCGYLNGKGGVVLIGVRNNGEIIGQDVTDNTQQEIANELRKFEPAAQVAVDYVKVGDRQVIAIQVSAGKHAPYVYDGRPFERTQNSKGRMTQHRYEQLLVERGQLNYSWEDYPAEGYDLDSLDHEEIYRTVAEGVHENRIPASASKDDVKQILTRLKLLHEGKLRRAAIVLFAKEASLDLPQCFIKMARFRGTDKLGDFIDNQRIAGHAFKLLESAEAFLRRHLPIASFFKKDQFQRIDKPALPVFAVREALINALCHRDYSNRSGSISLAIFDTHIEIWNNGALPREIKLEDLKHFHESIPRNERIASVFHDRGLIETWGTGTNKMINDCRAEGVPDPEFKERTGGLVVVFKFRELIGATSPRKVTADRLLTPRQESILAIIKRHAKGVGVRHIMAEMVNPPTVRTIQRDIKCLEKEKFIYRQGVAQNIVWISESNRL